MLEFQGIFARLKIRTGDVLSSGLFAIVFTGLVALLYNLQPFEMWPVLLALGVGSFLFADYLFSNWRRNMRKWSKRPTTFPNPEGGGILGVYNERPRYSELDELAMRYSKKNRKTSRK